MRPFQVMHKMMLAVNVYGGYFTPIKEWSDDKHVKILFSDMKGNYFVGESRAVRLTGTE